MLPRVLSVSDFQGCESFRPSAKLKPAFSSLRQHHHCRIVRVSTLSSSVFDDAHIPFLVLLCCFCQLDTRHSFRVQAYSLLCLPSFQHHSFFNKHHCVFSHSRFRHNLVTPILVQRLLIGSGGRLTCHPALLVAAFRSFGSLLVDRYFEAQRFSILHLQELLL